MAQLYENEHFEEGKWTEGVLLMSILLSYFGVTSWRNDVTAFYVTSVAK